MQTEITTRVLMTNEALYKLLDDEGFTFEGAYEIEDTYYSSLGGKEKVKEVDYQTLISHSMIVRKVTSDDEGEECLIYKNKKFNDKGNVIGENKIRLKVDSCDRLNLILKTSGFESWCKVINCSKWFKKGEIEIIVQEVEDLGTFIEVEEYESIAHLSDEEKFGALIKLVESLNIKTDSEYSVKKPYMLLHIDD